jgi:tellurite resistance protein
LDCPRRFFISPIGANQQIFSPHGKPALTIHQGEVMRINPILFAVIACCVTTSSMSAQSNHTYTRAKPAMWTALQLNEAQKAQVKAIHEKYASSMKAARKVGADSAASINDREMSDVRALLTSSQQLTFDSYMTGGKRSKRSARVKVMPAKIAVPR